MNSFPVNGQAKNNFSSLSFTKRAPVFKAAADVLSSANNGFEFGSSPFAQAFDSFIPPPPLMSKKETQYPTISSSSSHNSTEIGIIKTGEVNYRKSFSTYADVDTIRDTMQMAFSLNNILDVELKNGNTFEGRFFSQTQHTMAQFTAEICEFESKNLSVTNSKLRIVEFRKMFGDSLAFDEFISCLVREIGNCDKISIVFTEILTRTSSKGDNLCMNLSLNDLPLPLFDAEMSDDYNNDVEDYSYLYEIIDSIESGYAREITHASTLLVKESEKEKFSQFLMSDNQILPRLMNVICKSKDVLLVRSVLIALLNWLSSNNDVQNYGMNRSEFNSYLLAIKKQWSNAQCLFEGFEETIAKSDEIIFQANRALSVIS